MTNPIVQPTTFYHRFMTSDWIQKNAKFECNINMAETNEKQLSITTDARNYERVFHVDLVKNADLPKGFKMTSTMDITAKIRLGMVYTGKQPPDPISFMISDGDWAVGFQFLDRNTYHSYGPYYPIEGKPTHILNHGDPIIVTDDKIATSETYWPRVFEITLKPVERIGSCYCAIDGGHMIMTEYSQQLDPSGRDGLSLEVYRGHSKEVYLINFVEVTIEGNRLPGNP